MNAYQIAKEQYASTGIDTESAISRLSGVRISMHCWQGDDVRGFENKASLTGGIEATGNYPGAAGNPDELMSDLDKAFSLIPGRHRLNLHSTYALTGGREVGRDKLTYEDFAAWVDYAADRGIYLDMNPTLFSHPLAASGLTLSSPDEYIREFWIRHCKAVREIGARIGEKQGSPCLNNIWIPDGYKETPADRLNPRLRLKDSLDEIYKVKYDPSFLLDSVESKLFGIGVESYTVGSHEFYMNYAAKNGVMCLLDNGHFHPTENISDKISSMLVFSDKVALHISRGVRWDSDHVVTFTPELCEISKEIVAADALDRVIIALDYFDASINRVAAWVIGMRNMQKALLFALLTPHDQLRKYQDQGDFTSMLATEEEIKFYPYAAVWDEFCRRNDVPVGSDWLKEIKLYEKNVLSKRGV